MDYETRATNRYELRLYALLFRSICGFSSDECIDPVVLLDRLPDLAGFEDVRYEIVYGNELPKNVPAQCSSTDDGYLIQIKDTVYIGAHEKKTGGHRTVEINIEHSTSNGGVKQQKIHFVKEK